MPFKISLPSCLQKRFFIQKSVSGDTWAYQVPLRRHYGFKAYSEARKYAIDYHSSTPPEMQFPYTRIVSHRFSFHGVSKITGIFAVNH
jgi:hypothetical protein